MLSSSEGFGPSKPTSMLSGYTCPYPYSLLAVDKIFHLNCGINYLSVPYWMISHQILQTGRPPTFISEATFSESLYIIWPFMESSAGNILVARKVLSSVTTPSHYDTACWHNQDNDVTIASGVTWRLVNNQLRHQQDRFLATLSDTNRRPSAVLRFRRVFLGVVTLLIYPC